MSSESEIERVVRPTSSGAWSKTRIDEKRLDDLEARFYLAEDVREVIHELKFVYRKIDSLVEVLEEINSRETKNEVDGNLLVDYLKTL